MLVVEADRESDCHMALPYFTLNVNGNSLRSNTRPTSQIRVTNLVRETLLACLSQSSLHSGPRVRCRLFRLEAKLRLSRPAGYDHWGVGVALGTRYRD